MSISEEYGAFNQTTDKIFFHRKIFDIFLISLFKHVVGTH